MTEPSEGGRLKRLSTAHLMVVYGNVMLYSLCYMAQVPVMPYLTKKLGAQTGQYGTLQTIFSAVQFVGGLISGPFVDKYGGRALFVVSFLASVLSYTLTATATNIWVLYLSRLPTVLQHAILAARTIVTDLSPPSDRARVLGYVSMAYGTGFALGPALGGLMSRVSLQTAAVFATGGSVLSLVMVMTLLPRTLPKRSAVGKAEAPVDGPAWQRFRKVASYPGVKPMLAAKLVSGLASALFQSMCPVLMQEQFGLDSRANGFVLSYVGLLTIAVQAVVVGPVIRRLGEARAGYVCSWGLGLGFLGLAASRHLGQLLVALVPLCMCSALFSTVNTSQLTKAVPPSLSGTILALDMSLFSGVRMLSPALGAWAVAQLGYSSVGLCAAALQGLLLLLVHVGLIKLGPQAVVEGVAGEQVKDKEL